jgi:hypothetical protein
MNRFDWLGLALAICGFVAVVYVLARWGDNTLFTITIGTGR